MYRHSKLYAVISYITWIGFIIAMVGRDPSDPLVRRHLNQALIINIVETVSRVFSRIGGLFDSLGSLLDIACLILFLMGLFRAFNGDERPLPFIGEIELIR